MDIVNVGNVPIAVILHRIAFAATMGEALHADASPGNYALTIFLSLYFLTEYIYITFAVYYLLLSSLRVIMTSGVVVRLVPFLN